MEHAAIDSTGASKGSLGSYLTGFVLAIILTVIPFGLVMSGALPRGDIIFGVFAAAILQILVHLHYFLHLDRSSDERWNVLAITFTALAIVVVVGGSLWIMHNMHYNMRDHAVISGMVTHWLC
ncbi:MAG: cytochrome o ubiquinol oxidase subunit IV [Gammaproteobacteria bacterium]